jgi:hypothetical protein
MKSGLPMFTNRTYSQDLNQLLNCEELNQSFNVADLKDRPQHEEMLGALLLSDELSQQSEEQLSQTEFDGLMQTGFEIQPEAESLGHRRRMTLDPSCTFQDVGSPIRSHQSLNAFLSTTSFQTLDAHKTSYKDLNSKLIFPPNPAYCKPKGLQQTQESTLAEFCKA